MRTVAVACGISREYYNRIEKEKQPLNDELREVIEKQISVSIRKNHYSY